MTTITCHHCLLPYARLTVQGERSSQYTCGCCGETFDADHEPREHFTQARPQTIALPAVAGLEAITPAKEQARLARVDRLLSDVPKVRRAARMFDEQAAREATEAARGAVALGWVDSAR